jgi:hypothetical protein
MFDCRIGQMVFDLGIDVCYGHHLHPTQEVATMFFNLDVLFSSCDH